jgi:hypothetical protein
VLSPELRELVGVAETTWIGERPFNFLSASESGR